jgi:hypothetical protein
VRVAPEKFRTVCSGVNFIVIHVLHLSSGLLSMLLLFCSPKHFELFCDSKGGLAILHEVEPCQPKLEGDLTQSQSLMQVLEANTLSQKSELHLTQRLLVQMEGKSAG